MKGAKADTMALTVTEADQPVAAVSVIFQANAAKTAPKGAEGFS